VRNETSGVSGDSFPWEDPDHAASEQVPAGAAERAVRMVAEGDSGLRLQWAAICAVSGKLGVGSGETLRTWVRRAEVDSGRRPGVTTAAAAEPARLKRENAELRRATEILSAAAAFFGAELDRPGRR
jgi:transposase